MDLFQSIFSNGPSTILICLKLVPLITTIIILFIPAWKINQIRTASLSASLITFLLSLVIWVLFDPSTADFQFRYNIESFKSIGSLFNFSLGFGIDGISLWLILLTTFLTFICILS